jgi:hypothetical protein
MIEIQMPLIVPDSRKVTLTLPPEVPAGPATLTVRIEAPQSEPIVVTLDPANLPKHERSGLVRELSKLSKP